MIEKTVQINPEDNENIKSAFQAYQRSIELLKSFLTEDIKDEKFLTPYFVKSQSKGKKLEQLKEDFSKKYLPQEFKNIFYTYNFNFYSCSITYKGKENNETI